MQPDLLAISEPLVEVDTTFRQIVKELSQKSGSRKGGRPNSFDWKTYIQIVRRLEYGQRPEDLITSGIIKRNAFYDYKRKSPTFSNVIDAVSCITSLHALTAMAIAVRYIPAHYKTVRDNNGKERQVYVKEKKPNLAAAKWWLTHEKECRKRFNSK